MRVLVNEMTPKTGGEDRYVRCFDVFHSLLFSQNPVLPVRVAILHSPQDDFRHLQARFAQADYNIAVQLSGCRASRSKVIAIPYVIFFSGADIVGLGVRDRCSTDGYGQS